MSHTPLPTPSSPLLAPLTSGLTGRQPAQHHPIPEQNPNSPGTVGPGHSSRAGLTRLPRLPRPCHPHPEGLRGCEVPEQEEENHPMMGVLDLIGNDDVK